MKNQFNRIECTIPVLPVHNLASSLTFYQEKLDFQVDWGGQPGSQIASVSRDGCSLMLSQMHAMPPGVWVWIGVSDATLFQTYQTRGVKVRQLPRNYVWAYEMKFEDPDGNVLWMGTEPKADMPFDDA